MSKGRNVVAKTSESAKLADDSNTEVGDVEVANENIMNHVEAMQLFKDSLAEIIIVSGVLIFVLFYSKHVLLNNIVIEKYTEVLI